MTRKGHIGEIKIGNFVVPIYETPTRKNGRVYPGFTARFHTPEGLKRIFRSDVDELRAEVKRRMTPLATGQSDFLALRGVDRAIYERALMEAAALGLTLDQAVGELKVLKEQSSKAGCEVAEALRFYARHHDNRKFDTPVPELVQTFLTAKMKQPVSKADLCDLRSHLRRFANRFQCPLRDVTLDDFDAYFASLNVAPVTYKKYRGSILRLVSWARENRYLPQDFPSVPGRQSKVKPLGRHRPLLTRDDRERIISVCSQNKLPALLLAAYAPVRSCELDRASFEDIDWGRGTLTVYADEAKTGAARCIYLVPELLNRLRTCQNHSGKISPIKSVSRLWPSLAKRAGVTWRKNGWRKAVLSYLLAFTGHEDGVAHQGGTSVKELRNTYVTVVPGDVGAAWFGLTNSDFHPLRPISVVASSGFKTADGGHAPSASTTIIPFERVAAAP